MSLLGHAIRLGRLCRIVKPNRGLPLQLSREPPTLFSTDGDQTHDPPPAELPSIDSPPIDHSPPVGLQDQSPVKLTPVDSSAIDHSPLIAPQNPPPAESAPIGSPPIAPHDPSLAESAFIDSSAIDHSPLIVPQNSPPAESAPIGSPPITTQDPPSAESPPIDSFAFDYSPLIAPQNPPPAESAPIGSTPIGAPQNPTPAESASIDSPPIDPQGSPLAESAPIYSPPIDDSSPAPLDDSSPEESYYGPPPSVLTYGRLLGVTKYTLKSDIVRMFHEFKLTTENIRVEYDRFYAPTSMLVQFLYREHCDAAFKIIIRKGRLYRMERVNPTQWDMLAPLDAKVLLLDGIPAQAQPDDIARFLSGFEYDWSSIKTISRPGGSPGSTASARMMLLRFPTQAQAMAAAAMKNRCFLLNTQISARVLQ